MHRADNQGKNHIDVCFFAAYLRPMTRDEIRTARIRLGMTKLELAERAKVHRNTLQDMDSEGWNPRAKTMEALARVIREAQTPIASGSPPA